MSDTKCPVCGIETKYHGATCTAGGSFDAPAGPVRDAEIESLLREVMRQHADPDAPEYNECDTAPCNWCERAVRIIGPNDQAHRSAPEADVERNKEKGKSNEQ